MPSEAERAVLEAFGSEEEVVESPEAETEEVQEVALPEAVVEEEEASEPEGILARVRKMWTGRQGETEKPDPRDDIIQQQTATLSKIADRLDKDDESSGETVDEISRVFSDPGIRAQLEKIQQEDPDKLIPAMLEVMAEATKRGLAEVRKDTTEQVGTIRTEVTNDRAVRALEARINKNLEYISNVDPVAREIAEEYNSAQSGEDKGNTLLGTYIRQNGGVLASEWGLATAVAGLASMVQKAAGAGEASSQQPGAIKTETSALTGRASMRGQEINKPQEIEEELSEADVLLDGIYESAEIEEGLAELFRSS